MHNGELRDIKIPFQFLWLITEVRAYTSFILFCTNDHRMSRPQKILSDGLSSCVPIEDFSTFLPLDTLPDLKSFRKLWACVMCCIFSTSNFSSKSLKLSPFSFSNRSIGRWRWIFQFSSLPSFVRLLPCFFYKFLWQICTANVNHNYHSSLSVANLINNLRS